MNTIAILAYPDGSRRAPSGPPNGFLDKLSRISRYKRNPRPPEYMRAAAAAHAPGAEVIEIEGAVPRDRLARASEVVLLWPDAIGYGWTPIERQVFAAAPGARVRAVTGRQRVIPLSGGSLMSMRLRRVAERLCLGEIAMGVALLATAPFLVAWDLVRGRR
jgi:hypothetical protein